jgi:hypothetical protein
MLNAAWAYEKVPHERLFTVERRRERPPGKTASGQARPIEPEPIEH